MTFLNSYAADDQDSPVVSDEDWAPSEPLQTGAASGPSDSGPGSSDGGSDTDLIEVFWPYVPGLRSYLRRRVPPADVEDVLQDVLLNIVRRADAAAVSHPRSYLYQAAQATLVDRHRRQTARRSSCHCQLHEAAHPVDEISPLRILLARADIEAAEAILRQLPERTQEIIVAIRIEGSSLKNLANRYNISTSAIEKHVTKAAKALSGIRRGEPAVMHNMTMSQQRQKYLSGSI